LGAVDASALRSGDIKIEHIRKRFAPDFAHTFESLFGVMVAQEMKLRAKEASQTSQHDSQSVLSSQHQLSTPPPSCIVSSDNSLPQPSTPDQPTHPRDPKWSGSSTASQDEEATKRLLYHLLSDTMMMLESDFREITWQKSGINVELAHTYSLSYNPD
jgi:hypothetical protein